MTPEPSDWQRSKLATRVLRGEGLPVPGMLRYPLALVVVAAAVAARFALAPVTAGLSYHTFYPAIAIVALLFGAGPGLVAVAASGACAEYFFPHAGARSGRPLFDLAAPLGIFALSGLSMCFLAFQTRRQSLEALANERRFHLLAASSFEATAVTEGGRFIDGNDKLFSMLGYPREELIGQTIVSLLVPADRERVMKNIDEGRESRNIVFSMVRKNGEPIDMEASGQSLQRAGRMVRVTAMRDITERKRADQLLRLEHVVARCVAQADDRSTTLKAVMRAVCETQSWQCGRYFHFDGAAGLLRFDDAWGVADPQVQTFIEESREVSFAPGIGLTGRVWKSGEPLWLADISTDERVHSKHLHRTASTRAAFMFPVKVEGSPVGVLSFNSRTVRKPDERLLQSAQMIGNQIGQFLQRKQAEEELRIAAIAFDSQAGIIVTDSAGNVVRVNRAFSQMTGYSAEEAIGQTPSFLESAEENAAPNAQLWQALAQSGYWAGETWHPRKDGTVFPVWLTVSAVQALDGTATHYVGNFADITKQKEADAQIERLAFYDPLTLLPNRRLLLDRLRRAIASSQRNRRFGAVLYLDLDHFKFLNDTRGHHVGDQLLIEAARRIQAKLRDVDTVARLGGDEFVVVLESLADRATEAGIQAGLVAEILRANLEYPFDLGDRKYHCSASIGVALYCGDAAPLETLLQHADLAMYHAKGAGRNRVLFFDPAMQTTLEERSVLEADLRSALDRGQLRLHFQAQVDRGRRVTGAEALLRWAHPERGIVLPGSFISLAEETGLILPIGDWVIQTACEQIRSWADSPATRDLRLAVNVSARQFRQPDFVAQVARAVARTGANATRLKLELTESTVIDEIDETVNRMHELKALGIGFSMDDFGTGYSSLSCLKRLPLDQLKIDREFVRDLATDPDDAAIVQTIISMGKTLGLEVVAEGVENEGQMQRLMQYGCAAFQGYLFGRPMPLSDFTQSLGREPVATGAITLSA